MDKIYNYILDNIYIFCLLMVLVFVLIIFIVYLIKCTKPDHDDEEEKIVKDKSLKSKDELEKISDEEIEKRVIEEYKEETKALDDKLDKLKENYKDNSSVEEIIDTLKDAKDKTTSEALKKFEDEQEEQAIISYQQLVEAVRGGENKTPEKIETEDKDTQKILEKYENLNKEIEEEPVLEADDKIDYSYKPNEFISPVFGRMDSSKVQYREGLSYTDKNKKEEVVEKPVQTERQKRYDYYFNTEENKPVAKTTRLDSEEFLRNLKEFRKNL